ncbi:hypothetical protein Tco_1239663 [Tanacetum coccineum]
MDEGASNMKLWKNKFFLIDRRAILDYLTWRSSQSCVSDIFPTDCYDQNDVTRLCARLARLRDLNKVVLVWSGLSSVWLNRKCDPVFRRKDNNSVMSIYDFITLSSWGDSKVVEEPHRFTDSILQHVQNHTTAPATEGAPIPQPTSDEVIASQPDPKLAKKSKALVKRKASTSLVGPSEATQPKRKRRLKSKASEARSSSPVTWRRTKVILLELFLLQSCDLARVFVRLLLACSTLFSLTHLMPVLLPLLMLRPLIMLSFKEVGIAPVGSAGKARAEVIRWKLDPMHMLAQSTLARKHEYDEIPDDDFSTTTLGEEIDLTFLTEWDGPHAPEANILTKEIFKDPDVCKRALDRTITSAKLERTEDKFPLYCSCASNARFLEKVKRKVGHLSELHSEFSNLEERYEKDQLAEVVATAARSSDELARTDAKFFDQALVIRGLENELALEMSKSQKYRGIAAVAKQCFDELRSKVTRFVGFDVDGLVQKLLPSDEFNSTLAHILSLGVTSGVERGLRIGRTDVEFEEASQNVSNLFLGVQAEFDKVVAALPFTHFPFLAKISDVAKISLSEVASIQPDKIVRLVVPASTPSMSSPVGETFAGLLLLRILD